MPVPRARRWARPAHSYLTTKSLRPHGLRQSGGKLLVPMRDAAGALHNLQFIRPDGEKRFAKGGRCKGLYCGIGSMVSQQILLCEGWATGASLHEATAIPVACAMSANNLPDVALALHQKYPAAEITLCADHDPAGIEYASRAQQQLPAT